MVTLNKSISSLKPSPTLGATARAKELKAQGRDIISFTAGEPNFDTPQHIKDAAIEALKAGYTKYTPVGGILPLKEVICNKLKREQDIDASPAEVVITNGGKQSCAAAVAAVINPGDEVIIPAPYWTSYPDMVLLAGGVPVIVETTADQRYQISAEALEKACTAKTKMVILNTPSNPTGACYDQGKLRELGQVILSRPNKSEIVVLSDEVYEYITYDGFEHVSFLTAVPELRENTVLSNAFSKAYSMTGWRVGYAYGPKQIIKAMTVHQSQFTSNVCSIAQYAAAKAYDDNGAFYRMMAEEFAGRLKIVSQMIETIPGITLDPEPRGSFYCFPLIDELIGKKKGSLVINGAQDFSQYLLEEHDLAVVHGEAFGAANGFRLSFATDRESLQKGLERLRDAAAQFA